MLVVMSYTTIRDRVITVNSEVKKDVGFTCEHQKVNFCRLPLDVCAGIEFSRFVFVVNI